MVKKTTKIIRESGQVLVTLLFFTILPSTNSFSYTKQVYGEDDVLCFMMIDINHAIQADSIESCSQANLVRDTIQKILKINWLQTLLPEKWGVFVSSKWTASAGYSSPQTKLQNGFPAVLLSQTEITTDSILSLLSHEVTHLIQYRHRPLVDIESEKEKWVREGLAMITSWRVSAEYNIPQQHSSITAGFEFPETSLISVSDPSEPDYSDVGPRMAQYGHILQYFYYIYNNCGGWKLMNALLTSNSKNIGLQLVDETLGTLNSTNETCSNFKSSFKAFSIARFKQGLEPGESVYIYSGETTLREQPYSNLPPYSSSAYKLKEGKKCRADETHVYNYCVMIRYE